MRPLWPTPCALFATSGRWFRVCPPKRWHPPAPFIHPKPIANRISDALMARLAAADAGSYAARFHRRASSSGAIIVGLAIAAFMDPCGWASSAFTSFLQDLEVGPKGCRGGGICTTIFRRSRGRTPIRMQSNLDRARRGVCGIRPIQPTIRVSLRRYTVRFS